MKFNFNKWKKTSKTLDIGKELNQAKGISKNHLKPPYPNKKIDLKPLKHFKNFKKHDLDPKSAKKIKPLKFNPSNRYANSTDSKKSNLKGSLQKEIKKRNKLLK